MQFGNVLKSLGVGAATAWSSYAAGPELAVAMLACARIGAVHSVIFGGFSAQAIIDRVNDAEAKVIVTADGRYRQVASSPEGECQRGVKPPSVAHVVVLRRVGMEMDMREGKESWWHDLMKDASADCPAEKLDSEHPLFILYTSGTTGKPKGVVHTTGGYLTQVAMTTKWVFDLKDNDTYWCTADIGWITGHSYVVYGPLANGATSLMYEGAPNWPGPDRFWHIIDAHKVSIFTLLPPRSGPSSGGGGVAKETRSAVARLLGTVGEPINPEAGSGTIRSSEASAARSLTPVADGDGRHHDFTASRRDPDKTGDGDAACPVSMSTSLINRGSRSEEPESTGDQATALDAAGSLRRPGTVCQTVLDGIPGVYYTGDGARKDEHGYFWIMGRVDDVINVSGHRLGTAEIESALVSHPFVAEAAVVGRPDEIKGPPSAPL